MEQHGNTSTYNVENVLRQNIVNSDYYNKTCEQLLTWDHVVDEIYDHVDHVEPWMSGNARGPSTAFCLLYRLFTLKLNVKQIKDLLDHRDSPYIRAVGFLYLRYVADPKTLWGWCQRYVNDREDFQPSGPQGKTVTMGEYVRDLLLEQNYFETLFVRIPKKVGDEIVEELKNRGLPTTGKGNGGQGGQDRRGTDDGNRRPASVKASLSVAMGQRAPNRSGAREEGRGKDPSMGRGGGGASGRDNAPLPRSRSPAVGRGTSADRNREQDRSHGRQGYRDKDSKDSSRDRERDREADRRDDRGREDRHREDRERERGRDERYSKDGRCNRDERYSKDERYSRDERRGRDERDRRSSRDDRERRSSRDDKERRPERSRSRSPQRQGDTRDTRDVFRDRAAGVQDDVRAKYGDASGKLFDNRSSRRDYMSTEEVYSLGGSRR